MSHKPFAAQSRQTVPWVLMAEKGLQKGWGLGRHVLGSNYFH